METQKWWVVGGCPNQRRQATMIIFFPCVCTSVLCHRFFFIFSLAGLFFVARCVCLCVCARSVVPAFHTFSQQATLLPLITGSCVSLCVCAAKFSLLLSAAPHTAQHSHKMFVWPGWRYSPALSLYPQLHLWQPFFLCLPLALLGSCKPPRPPSTSPFFNSVTQPATALLHRSIAATATASQRR